MSYRVAMVRTPWRRPGWLVTSLTRSPCMWSSGGRSRSPAMYAAPVLAGMLGLLLDRTGHLERDTRRPERSSERLEHTGGPAEREQENRGARPGGGNAEEFLDPVRDEQERDDDSEHALEIRRPPRRDGSCHGTIPPGLRRIWQRQARRGT